MYTEVVDEGSGAILFKKTKETKDLEYAMREIMRLDLRVSELEEKISRLESNN